MEQAHTTEKPRKWYNAHIFPLIPTLKIKKADPFNTAGFTFRWLFLTIWSLDHFDFELSVVASTHWGIGFVGILPYLRWVLTIPCPYSLDQFLYKHFQRRPKARTTSAAEVYDNMEAGV